MEQLNLATRKKAEESVLPPGYFKILAIDTIAVLSAGVFGLLYTAYLGSSTMSAAYLLIPIATLGMASIIGTIMTPSLARRLIVVLLEAVMCAVFFWTWPIRIILFAVIAFFLLLLWGELSAHSEGQNALEVPIYSIARGYAGKIVTAATVFVLIMYVPSLSAGKVFVPESTFRIFYSWFSSTTKRLYSEIDMTSNIRVLSESLARYTLSGDKSYARMPPFMQKDAVSQVATMNIAGFEKYFCEAVPEDQAALGRKPFCTSIQADESVSSFAYRYINYLFNKWEEDFGATFLVAWSIAVFFLVRTLGTLLSLFVSILGFLAYHILLAVEFIKVVGEARVKESPTFPSK